MCVFLLLWMCGNRTTQASQNEVQRVSIFTDVLFQVRVNNDGVKWILSVSGSRISGATMQHGGHLSAVNERGKDALCVIHRAPVRTMDGFPLDFADTNAKVITVPLPKRCRNQYIL